MAPRKPLPTVDEARALVASGKATGRPTALRVLVQAGGHHDLTALPVATEVESRHAHKVVDWVAHMTRYVPDADAEARLGGVVERWAPSARYNLRDGLARHALPRDWGYHDDEVADRRAYRRELVAALRILATYPGPIGPTHGEMATEHGHWAARAMMKMAWSVRGTAYVTRGGRGNSTYYTLAPAGWALLELDPEVAADTIDVPVPHPHELRDQARALAA